MASQCGFAFEGLAHDQDGVVLPASVARVLNHKMLARYCCADGLLEGGLAYEGPSRTKITRQLTGSCDRGRMPPNGAILGRSAENRPEPGQPWWIGCNQGLYKSFMVNMWPVLRGSRRFYSDLVVAGTRSDSNWI
jgi:hypothetical protein